MLRLLRSLQQILLFIVSSIVADPELPGGGFTSSEFDRDSVQLVADKITDPAKRRAQIRGFTPFHTAFTRSQGVGPLFTNSSCGGCHVNNAKGPVDVLARGPFGSSAVVRIGFLNQNGTLRPLREWNGQIPLGDKRLIRDLGIKLNRVRAGQVTLSNGRTVTLYRHSVSLNPRTSRLKRMLTPRRGEKLVTAIRVSPAMVGMGLLEAIPKEFILARADPTDRDGDGVRGSLNIVRDIDGRRKIGRFGFRGQHASLLRQIAFAFFAEMGLENKYFKLRREEISEQTLQEVLAYLKYAGVPSVRIQNRDRFLAGYEVFKRIGCETCHASNIQTSGHPEEEFNGETISPFTNLLLHDLGRGMCDPFTDGAAGPCDWRTAPLWGLGLSRIENGSAGTHFLHDGRARSLEEAILWHRGEAENSRRAFIGLSPEELDLLLEFLSSL